MPEVSTALTDDANARCPQHVKSHHAKPDKWRSPITVDPENRWSPITPEGRWVSAPADPLISPNSRLDFKVGDVDLDQVWKCLSPNSRLDFVSFLPDPGAAWCSFPGGFKTGSEPNKKWLLLLWNFCVLPQKNSPYTTHSIPLIWAITLIKN